MAPRSQWLVWHDILRSTPIIKQAKIEDGRLGTGCGQGFGTWCRQGCLQIYFPDAFFMFVEKVRVKP